MKERKNLIDILERSSTVTSGLWSLYWRLFLMHIAVFFALGLVLGIGAILLG